VIAWKERPREFAHLLNPAFLGLLVAQACVGYVKESQSAPPFPLMFLVLPIVLHRSTRERLPRAITTRMTVWLENFPEVRVGFPERVRAIAPYLREAVRFSLATGMIRLTEDARLEVPDDVPGVHRRHGKDDAEVNECLRGAVFVGRWLAGAGPMSTIFVSWGVRP
jgi:Family of unknown function (DUF6521)